MSPAIPAQTRVVIIGGGIIGCSVAYHLTRLGWTDVVLLEQGQLSCGTTWHAAGLVGQLRSQESTTRLIRYSTQLYSELEAETGLGTGWKQCGSLSVARTAERMTQLRRTAAVARAYGVECEVISPAQAGELWPAMRTDDLLGAVWLPGDGKANPTDLTQALARGARSRGARIAQDTKITAVHARDGRATGVSWRNKSGDEGRIEAEIVVNCAGQWARQVGQMCGVTVPLHSAEHYYIVTERIAGVHPDLPVMRDPDGFIYFKEEVGGLVMGGFEPDAKPWGMEGIPEPFEFQLLPDDWDQFQILMENALVRVPALETAQVKQFYNGPESFTPDNNFILGEAPELRNFYVGAGFNSMGIASAGGAGMALAEWIVAGEPTMDLWPVDIRRFAGFNGNQSWLHDRVKETLGLHYAMPWPNRELESARPFRRSPLYAQLRDAGANFGSKMGWERPNFFAPPGTSPRLAPQIEYAFGQQNWLPWSGAEHRACRDGVALFDMSSFSKYLVKGADAEAVLQYVMSNDVAVPPGQSVYTAMLNERGTYESDLTVTRLAHDQYLVVTGSAQTTRDFSYIERLIPGDKRCVIVDVTGQYAVLAVMGPRSRELLQQVSRADFSNEGFPFGSSREIDLGYATVRATRLTYVGELGWELYVPVEFAVGVYETLHEAGRTLGLVNAGYYAIESLRLEKGYRAWGRELSPSVNPFEAGLSFACKLASGIDFRGREALLRLRQAGAPARRMVVVTVDGASDAMLWGGEAVLRTGPDGSVRAVGSLSSAAFGHTLGCPVGMALLARADGPADAAWLEAGSYRVDLAGALLPARVHLRAPYDPASARPRA
ncbi:FAD-dependent oxidoreductase [Cupriavidus taiwanensis]|uniref:GcvT family protein n=1 Tax=Cupriavidus taiwanensis TaxID=164546 RepID=UPI000E11D9FB|nr:FAD-dependent oxidoreductase [Cupriavidus taiwanensis]SOZ28078.1 sarcosine deshydrogenase [Cupriavidus taiwanensis]SPA32344.1 sarcosine deshydrogenase [Cupriavidus taiwanensis]